MTTPTPAWDDLPADFVVVLVEEQPITLTETSARYPLATLSGMRALQSVLMADVIWRKLTKPQRELLLSCVAGYPIAPRADVKARMVARDLVDEHLAPTEAGRVLVQMRPLTVRQSDCPTTAGETA